jgi:hypothetical protein
LSFHAPAIGFGRLLENISYLSRLEKVCLRSLLLDGHVSALLCLQSLYLGLFDRLPDAVFLGPQLQRGLYSALLCLNLDTLHLFILNTSLLNKLSSSHFLFFDIFLSNFDLFLPFSFFFLLHFLNEVRLSSCLSNMSFGTFFIRLHLIDAPLNLYHHVALLKSLILGSEHLPKDLILQ